jgi:predicted NBD/HSP70 family sugar kinase
MYLLFDIGGTKFRYALSRDGKTIKEPIAIIPTPKSFEDAVQVFSKIQKELKGEPLKTVVAGIAGPLDEQRSILVASSHIVSWVRRPLKKELERIFKVPAYLENDSALVGLGEAVSGAGQNYPIVAYLTVSTGVGGARIVEGEIDRNAMGFEPGHQIVDFSSDVSCGPGCKGKGHLESFVSGSALERRVGKKAREVSDLKIWDEAARILAVGLNNTVVHWSPDIMILGGSMILGNPAIPLDKVRGYLKEVLTIFPEPPPIVKATLGDAAGLYGALKLAKQM